MQAAHNNLGAAALHSGNSEQLNRACLTKDMTHVTRVLQSGAKPDGNTLDLAIRTSNPEIVQAIQLANAPPSPHSLCVAIGTGNLLIVKSVIMARAQVDKNALDTAQRLGNRDILNVVSNLGRAVLSSLNLACKMNDPVNVTRSIQMGVGPDANTLDLAIQTANPRIVEEVQLASAVASPESLRLACQTRNISIVRSAIMAGANSNALALNAAFRSGNREIVDIVFDLSPPLFNAESIPAIIDGFSIATTDIPELIKRCLQQGARPPANTHIANHSILKDHVCLEQLLDAKVSAKCINLWDYVHTHSWPGWGDRAKTPDTRPYYQVNLRVFTKLVEAGANIESPRISIHENRSSYQNLDSLARSNPPEDQLRQLFVQFKRGGFRSNPEDVRRFQAEVDDCDYWTNPSGIKAITQEEIEKRKRRSIQLKNLLRSML